MESLLDPLQASLLAMLTERGFATSSELQQLTGKSQPTISRTLRSLSKQLVTLGQGKRTRYGLPQSIHGLPAQQPLWWTDAQGRTTRFGTVTLLAGDRVHVAADGIDVLSRGQLPWFLAPLRLQGFLGREWALRLGLDGNPERWGVEQVLYAAVRIDDHPGAISIGDIKGELAPEAPVDIGERAARYDTLAADVTATLPAGSSAGGEQSKFLSALASGERVLVKFSPPRGTPFGERWHDLLHAEWLALYVLAEHGFEVAPARVIESATRTYFESTRFDRIGANGRRHAVALDAVHEAFVVGPRQHWAASCEVLAAQRRLSQGDADTVRALLEFGRLIGNTDMHFGNLSLWADEPAKARFALAPLYDMLPMRWRPDAFSGLQDYSPFEPPRQTHDGSIWALAQRYWQRLSTHAPVSPALRSVAGEMTRRLSRP
jgi:hypothetical protein